MEQFITDMLIPLTDPILWAVFITVYAVVITYATYRGRK
jgi:hypothetical protein